MCMWCGHLFSSVTDGNCDPCGDGRSCGCTVTAEKQKAWFRWIEIERPGRWVDEDWDYIMRTHG